MNDHLPHGTITRPATDADIPAIHELVNVCAIAQTGAPFQTEDEIRTELQTPGFDMQRDTWAVLTPDNRLVGYGEFWNVQDPKVRPYFFGRVHPDFCGQGIGTHLLRWAENRANLTLQNAPDGARVCLRCSVNSTNQAAHELFYNEGYIQDRAFYRMVIEMDSPPPAPIWPDGITVRTVELTRIDIQAAYEANEEAFRDHWGYLPISFDKWWHWVENDPDFDPTLWFLAVTQTADGEAIIGTCFCRFKLTEDPQLGWIDDLAVRRPWRRQGIALALLHHAFGELYRRGQRKVGLGVDADSLTGATRVYEKAGMHVTRQHNAFEKELRAGEELSTQTLEESVTA